MHIILHVSFTDYKSGQRLRDDRVTSEWFWMRVRPHGTVIPALRFTETEQNGWLEIPFISHLFDKLTARISAVAVAFIPEHWNQKPFSPICMTNKKMADVKRWRWCEGPVTERERERYSHWGSNVVWKLLTHFCESVLFCENHTKLVKNFWVRRQFLYLHYYYYYIVALTISIILFHYIKSHSNFI